MKVDNLSRGDARPLRNHPRQSRTTLRSLEQTVVSLLRPPLFECLPPGLSLEVEDESEILDDMAFDARKSQSVH